jgi:hypothetical protein
LTYATSVYLHNVPGDGSCFDPTLISEAQVAAVQDWFRQIFAAFAGWHYLSVEYTPAASHYSRDRGLQLAAVYRLKGKGQPTAIVDTRGIYEWTWEKHQRYTKGYGRESIGHVLIPEGINFRSRLIKRDGTVLTAPQNPGKLAEVLSPHDYRYDKAGQAVKIGPAETEVLLAPQLFATASTLAPNSMFLP